MAPDLARLSEWRTQGYADNGVPRDPAYIIPDIVYDSPMTRKIRVINIGAGVSGIQNAYLFQKYASNIDFKIYDKNHDIGGTWLENRYPGCANDVPSHAYAFSFALNPDWPRWFSHSPDIWNYLDKVCEVFRLRKYMTFNTRIVGCYWQHEQGEWLVKMEQTRHDGSVVEIEDRCNLLLNGTGILNKWTWPDIPGLKSFKGKVIHTTNWPKDYQSEQWAQERVAIIGSGASAIQVLPSMQPKVKQIDTFIRSGTWFVDLAGNKQNNREYTNEEKGEFHGSAEHLVSHAKKIENQLNSAWGMFFKNSKTQLEKQEVVRAEMAEAITDKRILDGFLPSWPIGCRRATPGDPYMRALCKDNVSVHFTEAARITDTGVVGGDGIERECDTIICATGFDVSHRPQFPIVGLNGVDLRDKWAKVPESYLGIGIPDFPNYMMFIGPTWPVENGSVLGPLLLVGEYALQVARKLQTEYIRSLTPKQSVTDAFNAHAQEWVRHTVWTEDCHSWYKNHETGRVNAIWPGSSLHYMAVIRTPRYEDYDITYLGPGEQNMWAHLGMGANDQVVEGRDWSPYLRTDALDPDWIRAMDIAPPKSDVQSPGRHEAQQNGGDHATANGRTNGLANGHI
ncbi:hypothetical protein CLAIMM_00261 [Cladophialophora immunda]|nr:hypothetical protein CLAIMM_00261 [Cladophialophora immunda]